MRFLAFAAAVAVAAAALGAPATQAAPAAEAPRHKCGAAPKMPGRTMMQEKSVRRDFERDMKTYKDCMTGYVEERNAVAKANHDAANAAIDEYNGAMKALNEAQQGDK